MFWLTLRQARREAALSGLTAAAAFPLAVGTAAQPHLPWRRVSPCLASGAEQSRQPWVQTVVRQESGASSVVSRSFQDTPPGPASTEERLKAVAGELRAVIAKYWVRFLRNSTQTGNKYPVHRLPSVP